MERQRGQALLVWLTVVGIAALFASGAEAKLKAEIIRSKGGIPTIRADTFKGLGFGYGYAFAEDNICTMAESYVTSDAERSRFFGPDARSPEGYSNLESDLFYERIKDVGIIDKVRAEPPPVGPKKKVNQTVKGYVAGYNRYLDKTGVDNLSDPTCAGAPWVRDITTADVWRRFYQLGQLASGQVAEDGIADAAPPAAASAGSGASGADGSATPGDVAALGSALDSRRADTGSNGWGIGSDATENGSGMVLGNPHFPWQGSERFYQSHLVVPGKLNVSGASLFGVPVINIGHTAHLAWTHTVSTAFRFVPIQLTLVPGDPTSYLVDGQPEKMQATDVTVQVKQPDGSLAPVTRTLYTTRYGPVFTTLQGQSLFDWTPTTAYAMYDANADNLRYVNHFLDTNRAQSTNELLDVLKKYEGIPWVNTMASDSRGKALYADIGSIPNVPNSKATGDCQAPLGALTFPALGLPILDGSRTACAPGTDSDSVVPGIFGPSSLPTMFRRDYVANSNDSYWLTNPAQPLEGFARIIGDERTPRTLRTRLGLTMLEQRLAGTDGYAGDKFSLNKLRRIEFNDRLYGAELFRSTLASFCHSNPIARQLRRRRGERRARLPGARRLRRQAEPRQHRRDPLPPLHVEPRRAVLHDAVRRERPGQHAVGARHLRPRRRQSARRRGHRPQRRRDPVRRAAGPVPVRAARGREHPDPRRPRQPGRLQRDHRPLAAPGRLPGRHRRLELHHGRRLRQGRQEVREGPHDPHLLGVGEPEFQALRRPNPHVLQQGVAQPAVLPQPGRGGGKEHEGDSRRLTGTFLAQP